MKFVVRLGVMGLTFVAMFSIIGLRLWFVQVAEGPAIAAAAEEQTWIDRQTQAPRGSIFDRNGTPLVTSRIVPSVWIDRTFVQPEERDDLIQKVSAMLGIDPGTLSGMYDDAGLNGRFEVTTVSPEIAYKLVESLDELPGVEIVRVPERVYLAGPTLAHVIGHLGAPNQSDLEERPDLNREWRIGQFGVEKQYDEVLGGTPGTVEYRVRRGEILDQRPGSEPAVGNSVELTIDIDLQEVVELALEDGISLSNSEKDPQFPDASRAAAIVLDARTFEVLAVASVPDFHPFERISSADFEALKETNAFNNLAISGLFPPASTFKAITYAAFEEIPGLSLPDDDGVDPAAEQVDCDGELTLPDLADGSPQVKHDWYWPSSDFGWLNIHDALTVSCNIFFWNVGLGAWHLYNEGRIGETVLQDWAKSLGYGTKTGIDLAGESAGAVPTRELFEEWAQIMRENPDGPVLLDSSRLEAGSPFFGGDLMDFAIGQGAFTATPLQVAVSYAALANGGVVREPRVVRRIIDANGKTVERLNAPIVRTVPIDDSVRRALLHDLHCVVVDIRGDDCRLRGTAARAFRDFGDGLDQVGGKTGTAQTSGNLDSHAWFVGLAPLDSPKYVVAVVIENGGSGGLIAAPVARHILQYLMGNEPTEILAGEDTD